MKFFRKKQPDISPEQAIEKRYIWEYRLKALGIKPFSLKHAARVTPAVGLALSSWVLPVVLVAAGTGALAIAGTVLAAKLGAAAYASIVISKDFRAARQAFRHDMDSGTLAQRYAQETGLPMPRFEKFLSKRAPERLMPGNDNRKGIFNIFSRKKAKALRAAQSQRRTSPTAPSP